MIICIYVRFFTLRSYFGKKNGKKCKKMVFCGFWQFWGGHIWGSKVQKFLSRQKCGSSKLLKNQKKLFVKTPKIEWKNRLSSSPPKKPLFFLGGGKDPLVFTYFKYVLTRKAKKKGGSHKCLLLESANQRKNNSEVFFFFKHQNTTKGHIYQFQVPKLLSGS